MSPSTHLKVLAVAPPSISAHPETLKQLFTEEDLAFTTVQMLDRLAAGLVSVPVDTFDEILILTDPDHPQSHGEGLLTRLVMEKLVAGLKVGGRMRSQDRKFGSVESTEKREALLAGLVRGGDDGMVRPDPSSTKAVPLKFSFKGKKAVGEKTKVEVREVAASTSPVVTVTPAAAPKRAIVSLLDSVGFDDFNDLDGDDDDLVDEDNLLTEADKQAPIVIPLECQPKPGKRRRACKDCSCGLKEQIEKEDGEARDEADAKLKTLTLGTDDLSEMDFTVLGKVGSCGNCTLGDAFRCGGCPYIGLPPFKPGEEVRLLNNDFQL